MLAVADFVWREAPLSSLQAPIGTGVVYVIAVLVLSRVITPARAIDTKPLQALHNLVLCLLSAVMAIGTLREVVVRSNEESSVRWMFCENPSTQPTGALFFWSYVYYLSKYHELLDTVLQLLKGRPPPHFALHVYHHSVVLLMAWAWLEYAQSLQYFGLLFNTSVHVLMYYYYYRRVMGVDVWWKHYVTQFQIVQFVTSLCCYAATLFLLYSGAECAGTGASTSLAVPDREVNFSHHHHSFKASFSRLETVVFNVTLLYQFVNVLKKGKRQKKSKAS